MTRKTHETKQKKIEVECSALKVRIEVLIRDKLWAEAIELLSKYDKLKDRDPWAKEQRRLIQHSLALISTPKPYPAPLPPKNQTTPQPVQQFRPKTSVLAKTTGIILAILLVLLFIMFLALPKTSREEPIVESEVEKGPVLLYFDIVPNHTYSYVLVTGIQDDVITDGSYQLQTGSWVIEQILHEGNSVNGRVMTYTGSRQLLRDMERMYLGPEADQNRGIQSLSYIDDTDLDFSPTCNCFIQISTDVYLGYETINGYSTKYLIYSEYKAVKMGGLVCSRNVMNVNDSANQVYRSSRLWAFPDEYNRKYWREKLGFIPDFNYQVLRYEAISDVPENRGILGMIHGTSQYDQAFDIFGVNNVENWAVMFSKEKGITVITLDVSDEISWGSAYVLVDG